MVDGTDKYKPQHNFKPGDVVQFKSGGNLMTVEKIDSRMCCVVHCGEKISTLWVYAITLIPATVPA